MSGSHCFCVPPVLACVCFFPVLVLVESEHYISILTARRSMRHAACACPAQPADQRHAARARESRRLLAAVATACIFDSGLREKALVARQLLPVKSNAHAGHCIACMLFRGRRRMSRQLPSKAREIWCERARVFQQTSTTSRSS